jgi:hypothetical protein
MTQRRTVASLRAQQSRTIVIDRGDPWQVSLVRVRSGVAAGNTKRGSGNVRTEWWAIFMTREQFEACCADDPLRFGDPLMFGQIRTEFDHVFDRRS